MATAKVFQSGNSQAIRLPKEFRVDAAELLIIPTSEGLLLRPLQKDMDGSSVFDALVALGEAMPEFERPPQGTLQERPEVTEYFAESPGHKKPTPAQRRKSA